MDSERKLNFSWNSSSSTELWSKLIMEQHVVRDSAKEIMPMSCVDKVGISKSELSQPNLEQDSVKLLSWISSSDSKICPLILLGMVLTDMIDSSFDMLLLQPFGLTDLTVGQDDEELVSSSKSASLPLSPPFWCRTSSTK